MSIQITKKPQSNSHILSPDMIDFMSDVEVRTLRDAIVKELPTQSPIFLPTDKIPLKAQVKGLMRVRDIYQTGLDSIFRPRLRALRKMYEDRERCFVIGNGPSLNRTDLSVLKDEVTFAVNGFFLMAKELEWLPTFYVVEDHLVAEDRRDAIEAFRGPIKLFPAYLGYCFEQSEDTIFFNHRPRKSYPHGFDFSTSADQITYTGCTVTFTSLQLAYYLGFKKIYLIGVDSDYAIPTDAEQKKDYGVGVIDMKSDDPNHFHPDYFGKGFRWHDPQVNKMLEAYAEARRVADGNGRSILNSTVGGKLEVFQRVAFSSLFANARQPEEMERIHFAKVLATSGESSGVCGNNVPADRHASAPSVRAQAAPSQIGAEGFRQVLKAQKTAEHYSTSDHQAVNGKFPRLLIFDITRFGDGTATGEVKATLFKDWPEDRLVQFHSVGINRVGVRGAVPEILRRNEALSTEAISRVVRWFRPDVILYRPVPDNLALHEAAMTVIRSTDLPLAIWMMDDWPARLAAEDRELFVLLDKDLRELLARADLRLSICDAMSAAFAQRYNTAFKAFANGIDPDEWPIRQTHARPFVLRYSGGLATDMGLESVLRAARAVERLASEGVDITFEINTQPHWQKVAEFKFRDLTRTSLRTDCPAASVYREWLSQADALLIAYNFDEMSKEYVRYSLANKLPECLASGAVLIAHGPSDVATIDYVRSLNCAIVVTDEDEEALASALRALVRDPRCRYELSTRAREVAFEAHNVHRVRSALHAEFLAIATQIRMSQQSGRALNNALAPPRWLWQAMRSNPRLLLSVLCPLAILMIAPAYPPAWEFRASFWGLAGLLSLFAFAVVGIIKGAKGVRRLLELQSIDMANRLRELQCEMDSRVALLEGWLAVLDKDGPDKKPRQPKVSEMATDQTYMNAVKRICEAANTAMPRGTTVIVVSKGDEQLLNLEGRRAWHFPQTEDGRYAGHYPADSAAAISHLERLRAKGADFLLVPETGFWWLDHYREFKQHLETHYQRVPAPECCLMYRFSNICGVSKAENESNGLAASPVTQFRPVEELLAHYRKSRATTNAHLGETELRLEIGKLLSDFGMQPEADAILTEGIRQDPTSPRLNAEVIRVAREQQDLESPERNTLATVSRPTNPSGVGNS